MIQRPKSRLKELRQKLVQGPEQRYYALSERGAGKLLGALAVNGVLMLLCIAFTTVCTLRGLPADQLRLVVFVQFLTMLLSALLGCFIVRCQKGNIGSLDLRCAAAVHNAGVANPCPLLQLPDRLDWKDLSQMHHMVYKQDNSQCDSSGLQG